MPWVGVKIESFQAKYFKCIRPHGTGWCERNLWPCAEFPGAGEINVLTAEAWKHLFERKTPPLWFDWGECISIYVSFHFPILFWLRLPFAPEVSSSATSDVHSCFDSDLEISVWTTEESFWVRRICYQSPFSETQLFPWLDGLTVEKSWLISVNRHCKRVWRCFEVLHELILNRFDSSLWVWMERVC